MKKLALLAIVAALGLAAAIGYTAKPAQAWDIGSLPAPYTVGFRGDLTGYPCRTFYVVTWYDRSVTLGYGPGPDPNFPGDCNPTFQHDLDAFVDATINLPPPTTTTVPPVTTTAATTTTAPTTTAAAPPATTTTAAPAETVTVTNTITIADPTVDQRLTALEQRQQADEARLATIEARLGLIVGEPKNEPPFTNTV